MADDSKPSGEIPAEWMEKIGASVQTIVNRAISARDTMSDKKREQERAELNKKFDELFSKMTAPAASKDDEEKAGKTKRGDDSVLKTLEARMHDLNQRLEGSEKARLEERAKNRNIVLGQRFDETYARLGGDPAKVKFARATLISDERRVGFQDEDGEDVVFRDETGSPIALDVGLKSWLKSDDGKHFLPPSGAKGSGSRPGGSVGSPTVNTKDELLEGIFAGLANL